MYRITCFFVFGLVVADRGYLDATPVYGELDGLDVGCIFQIK